MRSSYREDNYMSVTFGPIKTEKLIFQYNSGFYEIFAEESTPQRILFSYLFKVEEEKPIKNNRQQLTRNGVSSTQEPEDFFIDIILEKIK